MTQTSGSMLEDPPAELPSADRPPIALPDTSHGESNEVGGPTGIDSSLVADLLPEVESHIRCQRLPIATYRLQFNSSFTFRQATELVDYLDQLGITDLYASPLFQAREGSQSGYDVADYSKLSEDLGTREDFDALAAALRQRGLGLILDIVPNHMTTASPRNRWWLDVLENGALSPYASYFDIDWMPLKPDLAHKLLLPVLGDQYGKVLEDGQLRLHLEEGALCLHYHQWRFPLSPASYALVLADIVTPLESRLGPEHADWLELQSILTAVRNLPARTEASRERIAEYHREKEVIKRRVRSLLEQSMPVAEAAAHQVTLLNGDRADPRSFDRLDELLSQQNYRLAHWQVAADEINYRRFFDVNELAAICVENREVFERTHELVFDLVERGQVTGVRIDHPDGLFDPRGYLQQLQEKRFRQICRSAWNERRPAANGQAAEQWLHAEIQLLAEFERQRQTGDSPLARPLFIAVEKILGYGEPLPADWPVHGTVGYEFLNRLNGIFVDPSGEPSMSTTYSRFTHEPLDFRELVYQCKRLIVKMSMASELSVLGHRLDWISERNRWTRDFTLHSLTRALQEVAACFGVYRTYVTPDHVPDGDRHAIETAVARAKRRNRAMSASIFDFVRDLLLLRYRGNADEQERQAEWQFVGKFQQLTGPIMAKGVEDTAFYRFNRLVSLNEVGGDPERFGNDVAAFHQLNAGRLPRLARSLSSTATHDTKRSEDVRARINVLSEVPREWRQRVARWSRLNRRFRTDVEGQPAPAPNDEYVLYQSLVGIWPDGIPQGELRKEFITRVQQYMVKVVREAKSHSSWISPHQPYEEAVTRFVADIFTSDRRRPFLTDIDEFAGKIADHGRWNSLSQVVLKVASPGVPDFYQGTERWNLRLVDPDNRQPIDYTAGQQQLAELTQRMESGDADQRRALLAEMLAGRSDGRIKLFATLVSLRLRRSLPELFTEGDYLPLAVHGPAAEHLVAIARRRGDQWALAVAPRLTVKLCGFGGPPPLGAPWAGTSIEVPPELSGRQLCDGFTGTIHSPNDDRLSVEALLAEFPAALLTGR